MSAEDVAFVQAIYPPSGTIVTDLFRSEDGEALLRSLADSAFAPDVQVFGGSVQALGADFESSRGIDALLSAWREWLEPWETYRSEVEEFVDAGDGVVLILVRDTGRMHGSEFEVELTAGSVWTVRDRRVTSIGFYASRDEARAAARERTAG